MKNVLKKYTLIYYYSGLLKECKTFDGISFQINRFVEIILAKDKQQRKPHYKFFRVDEDEDKDCPTILHLAAQQGFKKISKTIVEHYPGLLYLATEEHDDKREYLPVELALDGFKDETAAYLIGQMKNEWYFLFKRQINFHHSII